MSPASFLFADEKKENKVFSVEEIYQFLLEDIRNDYRLQNILIEGEISNLYPRLLRTFSELRGKYLYCDLKGEEKSDKYGKITIPLLHCAMWQPNKLEDIHYLPKEGDAVLVRGNLTIYKERGQVQLTIIEMQPKGKGLLLMKLQALKEKLAKEGLFLEEHKKPIPTFPMRIALLAGANTAAQADVHASITKRWPLATIDDFPVPVQGSNAPKIICKKLKEIDEYSYDAIILARGGGSFEDLFYFNDEELARTIYQLQTFIVTGIGHEIDFTIAESVADLRAITPTAAAEKITPSLPEVMDTIHNLSTKMKYFTSSKTQSLRSLLTHYQTRPCFTQSIQHFLHPQERKLIKAKNGLTVFREKSMSLQALCDEYTHRLNLYIKNNIDKQLHYSHLLNLSLIEKAQSFTKVNQQKTRSLEKNLYSTTKHLIKINTNRLKRNTILLRAYSANEILRKGYSLTYKEGELQKNCFSLQKQDLITIRFYDGDVIAQIQEVSHANKEN